MKTMHIINLARPRLSDEEIDPMEQDDNDSTQSHTDEGWVPWTNDDLIDIRRVMDERMPVVQREVIEAFLSGMTFEDIGVSEKYYRYHYQRAIEFIRKELKI
jgi:DNA-directed RNA polymerase specialized sigma24 family protein